MKLIVTTNSEMTLPEFSPTDEQSQWKRFCELLWSEDDLGIWLDISRMHFKHSDVLSLKPKFDKAFKAMDDLEGGSIANIDEKRKVGHYWLRNPELAPSIELKRFISKEIRLVEEFGKAILNGDIKTSSQCVFTNVLWIGIGGSSLGPRLIVNAIKEIDKGIKFDFLDNIDPDGIDNILTTIGSNLTTTLFVVVSKSGGTPEPRLAMDQARKRLEMCGCNWSDQAVAITMPNSNLDNQAKSQGWLNTFYIHDWVGGRTSITSSVGLLTCALIGSDLREFLGGAYSMDELTRIHNIYDNPSALLALSWYFAGNARGARDMVILPYRDRLEVFSRYLQQLVMESLGKKYDRNGNTVNQGLSVYGNKGSTDQHAYVQQLRDGLDNFFAVFIEVLSDDCSIQPVNNEAPSDYLSGFYQGTRTALTESGRQNLTITLRSFNTRTLGALIALFERTVGLYSELININAYDQPGVEAGKKAASEILILKTQIEQILSDCRLRSIEELKSELPRAHTDSIFITLRYLIFNKNNNYIVQGDWRSPESLRFKKEK